MDSDYTNDTFEQALDLLKLHSADVSALVQEQREIGLAGRVSDDSISEHAGLIRSLYAHLLATMASLGLPLNMAYIVLLDHLNSPEIARMCAAYYEWMREKGRERA